METNTAPRRPASSPPATSGGPDARPARRGLRRQPRRALQDRARRGEPHSGPCWRGSRPGSARAWPRSSPRPVKNARRRTPHPSPTPPTSLPGPIRRAATSAATSPRQPPGSRPRRAPPRSSTCASRPARAWCSTTRSAGTASPTQVWVLEGAIAMTVGEETTRLGPGDCLFMRLDRPIVFHNPGEASARYAVVLSRLNA